MRFIDFEELLFFFQSSVSEFFGLQGMVKIRINYATLTLNYATEPNMFRFTQCFIYLEKCDGNPRPVLHKKDVLQIMRRQALLAENEEESF